MQGANRRRAWWPGEDLQRRSDLPDGATQRARSQNHRIRKIDLTTQTITTVAGTDTPGYSGDGGSASAAQLYLPYGVAVDAAGNLYIADTFNHSIRKVYSPPTPGQPTDVTATAGDAQATVTWAAPSNTGASAITSYTATAYVGTTTTTAGTPCTTTTTTGTLSCTVTELTNGTAYTFKVKATNTQGTGAKSNASDAVTPTKRSVDLTSAGASLKASFTGGGDSCSFAASDVTPGNAVNNLPSGVTAAGPQFSFTLNGCDTGSTVQMQIEYPNDLPAGVEYWKLLNGSWQQFTGAQWQGKTVTLTLTDGATGDADNTADGKIVDPGLPVLRAGAGAVPVPSLGAWALGLLSMLLGGLALPLARKRLG